MYSCSRRATSCSTNDPAYTGVDGSRAGSTQGSAPMWSSWPCVITSASMRSRHAARKDVSGRIFCMPRSWKL